jgi:FixJ family two-component response regulator
VSEFVDIYDSAVPSCLVLDVPRAHRLNLRGFLLEHGWILPVIVTATCGDVPTAVRTMKAGAFDFLLRPCDGVLLDRIRQALALSRQRRLIHEELLSIRENCRQLTPREREVAALMVTGKSSKAVAAELGRSPKTIEVHRAKIMSKMRAHSLAHLVRMWMRLETFPSGLARMYPEEDDRAVPANSA